MSKITYKQGIDYTTGKIDHNSDRSTRVTYGTKHTYTWTGFHNPNVTEAMIQTRTSLRDAQLAADAILQDPQQHDLWQQQFNDAIKHERRYPGSYARLRERAMKEQGKRIRRNSLEMPKSLRGFIISTLMLTPHHATL